MSSIKRMVAGLATTVVFLSVLLICAGRLGYWQGWVYAAISLVMTVATRLALRGNPDLEQERSKPGAGAASWAKKLLGLGLLLTLSTLVIAGLDSGRFHWAPELPWIWAIPGVGLSLAGMGIFLLALKENRFFSAVVRIQHDRNHTVCRTGPYKAIRHPGNAGMIVGTIGLPLLFTSSWSTIPALLSVAILVFRTHLEDKMLKQDLAGYVDYQQATRFRLIPGVW
jgi:protein-S-isoprenylcysteine O-methyltransferase Ste14